MFSFIWDSFIDVMHRGGPIMWPLLVLSLAVIALSFERAWFYLRLNNGGRLRRVRQMSAALREGRREEARTLAKSDDSLYGRVVLQLDQARRITDAAAVEAIETERRHLDRFMPTLSTIITAAPMLGILGTVLGIIASFEILGAGGAASGDPTQVSLGIAEALITTATGLIVALVALFPYNAFRAQLDATLSRLEMLAGAAMQESEKD